MAGRIGDLFQSADWKSEKHAPVIEASDNAKSGEKVSITASVGKEIAHPNKTEHHIRWIKLYFVPEGGKFAYDLGSCEFSAHGESTEGPDTGPAYTEPAVSTSVILNKSGTIYATSYCNLHGLWESSKSISVS